MPYFLYNLYNFFEKGFLMKKLFLIAGFVVSSIVCGASNFVQITHNESAYTVVTHYGTFNVTEPVLCELFDHPALTRIKDVEQYGIHDHVFAGYPSYSRYDHSVGVWALLRLFGASLEEQIAGLLHDASHTVFSHVGDLLFKHFSAKTSYQDTIHEWYLEMMGIGQVLQKYKISLGALLHNKDSNLMLEQDLPDICADRLEYNLQGGLLEKMLTDQDVQAIVSDVHFTDGHWYFDTPALARKLADVSLFHTQHVWGGPSAYFIDKLLSVALQQALNKGLLCTNEIHFGNDQEVWRKLISSNDVMIQKYLKLSLNVPQILSTQEQNGKSVTVKTKFRGIDPLIKSGNNFKRLSEIDCQFKKEYEKVRALVANWVIRIPEELAAVDVAKSVAQEKFNKEIEVKMLLSPVQIEQFKAWLASNAQYLGQERHTEYYLDNPKNSFYFYDQKKGFIDALGTLKIRCTEKRDSVCYKYRHIDPKTGLTTHRDEYESFVANGEQMLSLFETLGYTDKILIQKLRTLYLFDCFEVSFDEVKGIDTFVEVELKKDVESVQAGVALIYDFLKTHGIDHFVQVERSYVHMLANPGYNFGKEISL